MTTFITILYAWIKILFFEIGLEDNDLLHALQDEGFDITNWTLKRLRTQLDLWHHTNPIEAQQQMDEIVQAIEEELEKEIIKRYGKKLLHYHFEVETLWLLGKSYDALKNIKTKI